jgi:hypothetical protein
MRQGELLRSFAPTRPRTARRAGSTRSGSAAGQGPPRGVSRRHPGRRPRMWRTPARASGASPWSRRGRTGRETFSASWGLGRRVGSWGKDPVGKCGGQAPPHEASRRHPGRRPRTWQSLPELSFLGRRVGSWARIAATPRGLMPASSLRILASSSISWTRLGRRPAALLLDRQVAPAREGIEDDSLLCGVLILAEGLSPLLGGVLLRRVDQNPLRVSPSIRARAQRTPGHWSTRSARSETSTETWRTVACPSRRRPAGVAKDRRAEKSATHIWKSRSVLQG